MTHERYEIEFQGSTDGQNWTPYLFRYKPQDLHKAPGIYAPYQPRFEWDLWFASLGNWRNYPWVVQTEARLLDNEAGRAHALCRKSVCHRASPESARRDLAILVH